MRQYVRDKMLYYFQYLKQNLHHLSFTNAASITPIWLVKDGTFFSLSSKYTPLPGGVTNIDQTELPPRNLSGMTS